MVMARVLSFPFRLGANGAVIEVEQFTARADEEALAHLLLTHKGERPYAPLFGITNPTFGRLDQAEVRAGWSRFGTGRPIVSLNVANPDPGSERVTVELAR